MLVESSFPYNKPEVDRNLKESTW